MTLQKFDPAVHAFAVGLLLIAAAVALSLPTTTADPGDDFDARWDRCTALAQAADNGLTRADVPQMVEDCMDDGGPIEGLSVR